MITETEAFRGVVCDGKPAFVAPDRSGERRSALRHGDVEPQPTMTSCSRFLYRAEWPVGKHDGQFGVLNLHSDRILRVMAAVKIDPMKLPGPWADGYVLEWQHTLTSDFLGTTRLGPQFDTRRYRDRPAASSSDSPRNQAFQRY
jgi:hypothetical protein